MLFTNVEIIPVRRAVGCRVPQSDARENCPGRSCALLQVDRRCSAQHHGSAGGVTTATTPPTAAYYLKTHTHRDALQHA